MARSKSVRLSTKPRRYGLRGPNATHLLTVLATGGQLARWTNGRYALTERESNKVLWVSRNVATWCAALKLIEGKFGSDFGSATFTITAKGKQWLETKLATLLRA